jgi:diacylglycerol kinase (ATP)
MRVLLIGNPAAGGGRGKKRMELAERHLRAAGCRVDARLSQHPHHADELLRDPPGDTDRVIACGGDGLVSQVASALAGRDLPMGIVPAGRGNDVARALGVPLSLPLAARAAVDGVETRMDLGEGNGRLFCTAAACGLDAEVSRRSRASAFQLPGPGTYVVELLRALFSFPAFEVRIEHDGGVFEGRALAVAAANTPTYGGGFRIAPDAETDDGLLDLCVVADMPKLRAVRLFPLIFSGRHLDLPEVTMIRSGEAKLSTEPGLALEADGEALSETPVHYRVRRAVLPVVLPPGIALTPAPASAVS